VCSKTSAPKQTTFTGKGVKSQVRINQSTRIKGGIRSGAEVRIIPRGFGKTPKRGKKRRGSRRGSSRKRDHQATHEFRWGVKGYFYGVAVVSAAYGRLQGIWKREIIMAGHRASVHLSENSKRASSFGSCGTFAVTSLRTYEETWKKKGIFCREQKKKKIKKQHGGGGGVGSWWAHRDVSCEPIRGLRIGKGLKFGLPQKRLELYIFTSNLGADLVSPFNLYFCPDSMERCNILSQILEV